MRHSVGLRLIRLLTAVITAAAISQAAQAQDRVALVVGNSKYVSANGVPNAVNDARVMARALRDIGFVVADGYDLSRDSMERQIREFLRKSKAPTWRYFSMRPWFAGRWPQLSAPGQCQAGGRERSCLRDGRARQHAGKPRWRVADQYHHPRCLPQQSICAELRVSIWCRTIRHGAVGSRRLFQPRHRHPDCVSTAPGAVALDGNGSNSPFTKALARHVRTPGLEVRQMLTRVRADVAAETRGKQIPWDNSSLLGEVYLAGLGKPEPQRVDVPPSVPAPPADDLLWEAIRVPASLPCSRSL